MEGSGSSFAQPAPKKRRLITDEGTQLMRDLFDRGVTRPSKDQKRDLFASIQTLPGCEDYQMRNLENWFARRRRDEEKAKAKATSQTASHIAHPETDLGPLISNSPYPSLNPDLIPSLEIMFAMHPEPNSKLIEAWVNLTKATPSDILQWVRDKQATLNIPPIQTLSTSSEPSNPQFQRPWPHPIRTSVTPSASNDPSPATTSVSKIETPASPIVPPAPYTSTSSHLNGHHATISSFGPRSSESGTSTPVPSQGPTAPVLTQREKLLLSIDSAIEKNKDIEPKLPTSAKEFDELFAPYEKTFKRFLTKVESGRLENWGFHPDTVE
ncbi:hypothetical protein K435DRAFT_864968 [Dendrothele bispora CBS 962.96]|uniref:Homeobox domain-containing protein n=1 Tax=Dendrothele bispora (strain CBS 962.96) TaxID=1314807 RepID=A0A4S8LKS1_DENBC|nr:hypothetical protein K435DRAFT_864968 [Dendrothele bispora CBS 962.96]